MKASDSETSLGEAPGAELLSREPAIVTAGLRVLADALVTQAAPVTPITWRPPLPGTEQALRRILVDTRADAANARALDRLQGARPHLVDVRPAHEALGLELGTYLHPGPPIAPESLPGPLRGALLGAAAFEEMETAGGTAGSAVATAESSGIPPVIEPSYRRRAVIPLAGVVSSSMWVLEVVDEVSGEHAWCPLDDGMEPALHYGSYGPAVVERLRWASAVLGPVLRRTLRQHGPVDLTSLIGQSLCRGDDGRHRTRAGASLLLGEIAADLLDCGAPHAQIVDVARRITGNERFFANIVLPAGKVAANAASGVAGSAMVVALACNGIDIGIQVSGTGDQWFTGPARTLHGVVADSHDTDDVNPAIGDGMIAETVGLGSFALAAAPEVVRQLGGQMAESLTSTQRMDEITLSRHPCYQVPILDFRGTPTGIDVAQIARTGLLPWVSTEVVGNVPGVPGVPGTGRVGTGWLEPPTEIFIQALQALAATAPG